MNRATTLALAAALPAAALIVATGGPASATAPLGTGDSAEFVSLTDDTGTITLGVPSSWSDVDTAPLGVTPWISASPNFGTFVNSFDVPGVIYRAVEPAEDLAALARDNGYASACASEEVVPYTDGVFTGWHLTDVGCGTGGTAEYHVIAANPVGNAFTAVLEVQLTGPQDAPILDGILQTFDVAPAATASSATYPSPSGNWPSSWASIVDATNTIQLAAPATWAEVNVWPWVDDDGAEHPTISATTDESSFFPEDGTADTFSVPGVHYQVLPYTPDTTTRLATSRFHEACDAQPAQSYDDGVFAGHIQSFDACGGTSTRNVVLVANTYDQAFTAVLNVQLTGQPDDDATLDGLLSSFNTASGTPASAPPTSTTAAVGTDPNLGALVDQLGLTLTAEQSSCITSGVSPGDLEAAAADPFGMPAVVLTTLLNCGVDVFDIPSG